MRVQLLAGTLALAGSSAAFSDSSPWVVLSTSPFKGDAITDKMQTSDSALETTKSFLSSCPTENYAIIVQPDLHYADLTSEQGATMRHLWTLMEKEERVQGKYVVPEVVGQSKSMEIAAYIRDVCADKEVNKPTVVVLPTLPQGDLTEDSARREALRSGDVSVIKALEGIHSSESFTLVFLGTNAPTENTVYEPEFEEPLTKELKRNVLANPSRRSGNETDWNKLPLFEKYQFFTPGIFVGIVAALVIGTILTVGLRALSSLEVSYGAFEKDMGPSAHKKQ